MTASRRTVLLLGVGVLAAGCAKSGDGSSSSSAGSPAPSATASSSAAASASPTGASLPAVTAWQPSSNDLSPACKRTAARAIEKAGNGAGKALQVIFAQYGGLLTDAASVLVVTRSWTLADGRLRTGGHTYDVRLTRRSSGWHVDAIHPSRPGAVARHSAAARRVLASDRIDLPPAARRDVLSGNVHDSVLTAMLTLAKDYRVGISVIRSGHPTYVFGTDRLSDHPRGRAFDTWRIDGHAVVDPRTPKSLVTEYMHAVTDAGSYNTGGPYLLGSAPQWFSDDTHHDHVHAGFTT